MATQRGNSAPSTGEPMRFLYSTVCDNSIVSYSILNCFWNKLGWGEGGLMCYCRTKLLSGLIMDYWFLIVLIYNRNSVWNTHLQCSKFKVLFPGNHWSLGFLLPRPLCWCVLQPENSPFRGLDMKYLVWGVKIELLCVVAIHLNFSLNWEAFPRWEKCS